MAARRTCCARRRPTCTDDFVEANFDFYGRTLNGTPELRARWKRGVALVEGAHRRGRRQGVRRPALPADVQGDDGRAGRQPGRGLPPARSSALDWMTEETKQRAYDKLDTFRPKIGYPEKFRDYSALDDLARRPARQRRGGVGVRDRPPARARSARRSTATSGSCCRRPSTPTTTPAPTRSASRPRILQPPFFAPDADAGRELRRHRRRHRPRDRPRLRRPGRAVRRRRQPQRLVDRRRQGRLRGEVEGADRAVRRASSRATLPGEHVNGALTVGENIGDLGGLTIGHKAYLIAAAASAAASRTAAAALPELGLRAGAPSAARSRSSSTSPSTRTARRSSAPTSCATSTSSTRSSRPRAGDGLWLDPEDRVRIW